MEYAKRILAVLIGLGILVLIFVLVIKAFSGSSTPAPKSTDLVTYANTDASTVLYVDGPINYDGDHRTLKIFVSQKQIGLDVIDGYQGNVVEGRRYVNNEQSYAIFLKALQHLSFTKGLDTPGLQDERGYCATGNRYIYQFLPSDDKAFRYWSTSCGQGTFKGNPTGVRNLFYKQIPAKDFNTLVSGVPLG